MKILYISQIIDLNTRGLYPDLITKLSEANHQVTVVRSDSTLNQASSFETGKIDIVNVFIENQFGINYLKKGLIYLQIEKRFIKAIKKHLNNSQFDLILYATPPVTFANVIEFCKKKYRAKTYLMLKDIFPQNALDIGILSTKGLKGLVYHYFRRKEKKMYFLSDRIGCMSQGNIDYLLKHNPKISRKQLEIFPNAINPKKLDISNKITTDIKVKYQFNPNKTNFIFGGNLGKPQSIKLLMEFIERMVDYDKAHFIIVGKGTEEKYVIEAAKIFENLSYFPYLPIDEYTKLVMAADVGIIFLDPRFTIPNYPSRILSYMENEKPILACTDSVTDIKELVRHHARCGRWNNSNQFADFDANVRWFCEHLEERIVMGKNGRKYLEENFMVEKNIKLLTDFIQEE